MQNETEREVEVLKAKLAALEEAMRWRPIEEFPGDYGVYEVYGKDALKERDIVEPMGRRRQIACFGYTRFRPVLPGPEGA